MRYGVYEIVVAASLALLAGGALAGSASIALDDAVRLSQVMGASTFAGLAAGVVAAVLVGTTKRKS